MATILMVVSAAQSLTMKDGTEHPTGFWAEELVESHRTLHGAGHAVHIATPHGHKPTVDAVSLQPDQVGGQAKAALYGAYLREIDRELSTPLKLAEVDPAGYAAVVIPGGHGPMADLAYDANLGRILKAADATGTLIAPFCHGPAALLSAKNDADATFAFAGRRMTAFSNEEELSGGTGENTPWLLEDTLRDAGAVVETGPAWESFVVRDRNLITGQNPQSSGDVARHVLTALAG